MEGVSRFSRPEGFGPESTSLVSLCMWAQHELGIGWVLRSWSAMYPSGPGLC